MGSDLESLDVVELVPGGYPLTFDVTSASIGGAGTAMHFTLPLKGHNLPLKHRVEHKLVAALRGELTIRRGGRVAARLREGDAVLLAPGAGHRIHQHGAQPSVVGVALWPGAVEQAFRDIAAQSARSGWQRAHVETILAPYGVEWNAGEGGGAEAHALHPASLAGMLDAKGAVPAVLRQAVQRAWRRAA
jgi:quercetin dioxygenase-like cupin family protein